MTNRLQLRKIGILGHVGNGNLGDEAIFAAAIQQLRRRAPGAALYGFSNNPRETRARHRIPAFPLRRSDDSLPAPTRPSPNGITLSKAQRHDSRYACLKRRLKRSPGLYAVLKRLFGGMHAAWNGLRELRFWLTAFKALRPLDLLIVAGSNQLFDYFGGCWGFPYTLFKWAVLAKASRTKLAFLSVGAGPIRSPLSRFFLKQALALADYRAYRDESSRQLIESLGVSGPDPVYPDLAFGICPAPAAPRCAGAGRIVGINPMPIFADYYWPEIDDDRYRSYLHTLAAFAQWLIDRGYSVLFFPTQLRADPPAIDEIKHMLMQNGNGIVEDRIISYCISSIDDLTGLISSTDFVVATRFHGIVLSYMMNIPVLGISYHRKIDEIMYDIGQSEYIINHFNFTVDDLINKFQRLEANRQTIQDQIQRKVSEYRSLLNKQYDEILSLWAANESA